MPILKCLSLYLFLILDFFYIFLIVKVSLRLKAIYSLLFFLIYKNKSMALIKLKKRKETASIQQIITGESALKRETIPLISFLF